MGIFKNDSEIIARESQEKAASLLHRLQEMDRLYREERNMPDYNAILPVKVNAAPDVKVRTEHENEVLARSYLKEQKLLGEEKILDNAEEKLNKLDDKELDAYKELKEGKDSAAEEYGENNYSLQKFIAASGAEDSTVARTRAMAYYNEYSRTLTEIGRRYSELKDTLSLARETVESEKKQALREYDLKLADMYEKKLLQLQKESDRAAEVLAAYNKKVTAELAAYSEERSKQIAASEKEWAKAKEKQDDKDYWASKSAGYYVGESAEEMNARYDWALKKYKEMDGDYAIKHVKDNESELRKLLGSGYDWLLTQIGG